MGDEENVDSNVEVEGTPLEDWDGEGGRGLERDFGRELRKRGRRGGRERWDLKFKRVFSYFFIRREGDGRIGSNYFAPADLRKATTDV